MTRAGSAKVAFVVLGTGERSRRQTAKTSRRRPECKSGSLSRTHRSGALIRQMVLRSMATALASAAARDDASSARRCSCSSNNRRYAEISACKASYSYFCAVRLAGNETVLLSGPELIGDCISLDGSKPMSNHQRGGAPGIRAGTSLSSRYQVGPALSIQVGFDGP